MNHDDLLEVDCSDSTPVADERPARLMYPGEWREWQDNVRDSAMRVAAYERLNTGESISPGRSILFLRRLVVLADSHIRALLAENLQLRQDYERLRAELEPLRQHYLVLKRDTARFIGEKERREQEAKLERLGLRKRAWWRRWI